MTLASSQRAGDDASSALDVTIDDVIFRSDDERFAVVRGSCHGGEQDGQQITIVGDLGQAAIGETLRVRGRWERHATYGLRFRAHTFTPVMPTTQRGVARYLGSGLVPGVGQALAERLVQRFGERTLDVIATQSARLQEVEGIGPRKAHAIAEAVRARQEEAESLSFLRGLGLGLAQARKLRDRYGDDAPRVVREDPYLVAEQVRGIGFRTADAIGQASGIGPDDPRRAAGAVLHLLGKATDEGHVYATRDELREAARELDVPPERIEEAFDTLAARELIVRDGEAVYPPPLYAAECRVARAVAELAGPRSTPRKVPRALEEDVAGGPLTGTQQRAVRASLERGLVVLTGGPGTGKTTTVHGIVRAHLQLEHRVVLCAPTGRAAKRLHEATGYEARTIHRTLEWNPRTARFQRNADCPLDAELVLVDEASMLDLRLADSLLAAIPATGRLVLVGDVDQLPPVQPGQVLRDVIDSDVGEVVRLNEVFRQAQQSAIVRGAHAVLGGRLPEPSDASATTGHGDLFIVRADDPDSTTRLMHSTLRRMRDAYGLDPRHDVQVLTPMRRGPLGTEKLNELLQAKLNPPASESGDASASWAFRPGDKVMQLRNDYDRDVFNGDVGEVRSIEGGTTHVLMDGHDVQYGPQDLDALTLAYASTIHKVQGSEFPAVVVVLHGGHYVLLSRSLLYTAITRARRLVVLLGDERAMRRAARNAVSLRTNSRLLDRIRESL